MKKYYITYSSQLKKQRESVCTRCKGKIKKNSIYYSSNKGYQEKVCESCAGFMLSRFTFQTIKDPSPTVLEYKGKYDLALLYMTGRLRV